MENQEKKSVLNRKIYKDIKKYDREQMENFCRGLYENGFKDGFKHGTHSSQQADFKIELVQLLESIKGKGIGPKTKEIILQAYKERGSNNES